MFPEIDYDFEFEEEQDTELLSTTLGRTPLFDFKTGKYVLKDGKVVECTQEEAVRQWVGFLVKTAAEKYAVYENTEFGTYIENYIGYKDSAFVASEIKREIEEGIVQNRAIDRIEDFEAEREGSRLKISLTVVMTDETEIEVDTDVEE
ncbi:DUF2634 domain-containing protein [Senimuribacter intestinalis]|uniref:DUF2634 domain-containing protein n=1 Tax=Senimuribacter intestinalis TaxID=2941507 RepID=UPI00203C34CF|nr:DUF2634 domain-containing protein [Senimuribacter intestinalis]